MAEQLLSVVSEAVARKKNTSQFVGFQLAGQDYAFRIEQIQEIVILAQVTRTPQVPASRPTRASSTSAGRSPPATTR